MNLVVDFGNTRIKVGLFKQTQLIQHQIFENENQFNNWLNSKEIVHVIVSSVAKPVEDILKPINVSGNKIAMHGALKLPIVNNYKSKQTLGVDRIAAACGAVEVMPNRNRLVIDMGTCINYEFVDDTQTYHGGAISPGVSMRFKAMHVFTAKLPDLHPVALHPLIGSTTEECMQSGVMNGILAELDGMINWHSEKYPNLGVILCGGDAFLFENKLKQPIFVAPDLVLRGLNRILLHNVSF